MLAALALTGCGDNDLPETRVPTDGMLPTLELGARVPVDRDAYGSHRPERGDIVEYRAPRGLETARCGVVREEDSACSLPTRPSRRTFLMGRVMALPGDTVAFRSGIGIVNGEPETDRPLQIDDPACDLCDLPVEITVRAGHVFIANDSRSEQTDSREFGPVPFSSVTGRVDSD